jgi:hypothetical protein
VDATVHRAGPTAPTREPVFEAIRLIDALLALGIKVEQERY